MIGSFPVNVGSVSITGTGPSGIFFGGSITTDTAGVDVHSPVTLLNDATVDTSGPGGSIHFYSTLNGAKNLTLNAGAGSVFFDGNVGATTPLSAVTVSNATNVTVGTSNANTFAAASFTHTMGNGTTLLNSSLTTSGGSGISIANTNITRGAAITTTGGGPLTLTLSTGGTLNSTAAGAISLNGALTQTGGSGVNISGSISTNNGTISFATPLSLQGATNITTSGGSITLPTIDGANSLTMAAGSGNITISDLGSHVRTGALTVTSCTSFTAHSATASSISISGSGGTLTFNGDLNTDGVSGISLTSITSGMTAGNIFFGGGVTATNGGPLTTLFSGTSTVLGNTIHVGSLDATGTGGISFAGTIVTDTAGIVVHSPATLNDDSIFDTSLSGGTIHFFDTINGAHNQTLTAGVGNILLDGAIGGSTPLTTLNIVSAHNVIADAISAASILQAAGTGTSTLNGALTTTSGSGINLTGSAFVLASSVTTTNNGTVSINHTGTLEMDSTASFNLDGAFSETGGGQVHLGVDMFLTDDDVHFTDVITLTHNASINTGAGSGDIVFDNTIDGAFCLTLDAGAGDIKYLGVVGGTTPLNCVSATASDILQNSSVTTTDTVDYTGSIQIAGNITTFGHDITFTGDLQILNNLTFTTGTGTGNIAATGNINGDVAGRNLTLTADMGNISILGIIGNLVHLNNFTASGNQITWGGLGSTGLGASGAATLTATDTLTFSGTNYNNGAQIYTAGTDFIFNAGTLVTVTSNNLPISFSTGTIQLAAATPLTINSNGGNVTFGNLTVSDMNMTDLIVNAHTGSFQFTQIGTLGFPLDDVNLTASTFTPTPMQNVNVFSHSLSVNSPTITFLSGMVTIPTDTFTYTNPVVLNGDVTIDFASCPAVGTLTFSQTLDSDSTNRSLIINACGHSVTFTGPVGGISPFVSIAIDQAADVTVNSTLTAGSFVQTAGTGTTTIQSSLTTTDSSGINLATGNILLNGSIVTTGSGTVTMNNSGTFTLAGVSITSDGFFKQIGAGSSIIGGNIQTTDDLISFAAPVTLSSDFTLNTVSLSGADITFDSTIDGGKKLNLTAGSGSITLNGVIGGVTPLGDITINSASNVTATDMTATSFTQSAGTGITALAGTLNITQLKGISLRGNQFDLTGAITISNAGPLLVVNSGILTLTGGASISGQINQSGSGGVHLGGMISSGSFMSFAGAVSLTATTILDTSVHASNITFLSTLNGGHDLTLNLGTGSLFVTGAMGGTARLGALTISSVGSITAPSITAASIVQTAGSGTSTLGDLNTNTMAGISLTGTNFNINGILVTTALGPFTIINSAALQLVGNPISSISGAFSQSGGGAVTLAGTLLTVNQNLSFANAITLSGGTSLSTSSGAGTLTLSSTLNGNKNLTLTAGTGNIVFGGTIGATTPLAALTVQSCTDITYPNTKVNTLTQNASSGTTTLSSPIVTTGTSGIAITGSAVTQTSTLTSGGTGTITISHTGLYSLSNTISAAGTFTENGTAGTVQLNGSVIDALSNVSFANPITLTGNSTINTSGSSGNITLSSTVDGNFNLNLVAGSGTINLSGAIGSGTSIGNLTITSGVVSTTQSITAASISQLAGSGTYGALNTSQLAGIDLQGANFTLAGNVTTAMASAGPLVIQNTGALTLSGTTFSIDGAFNQTGLGTTTISSAITAGGTIQFAGPIIASGGSLTTSADISIMNTLDGPGNLTLNASMTGNVTFSQNVGSNARMGTLTINNPNNVTALNITAGSLQQTGGQGLSTFQTLNTNGASGIVLAGNNITLPSTITTTNGPVHITNSGTLNQTGGSTTVGGIYTQDGSGPVILLGTITTNSATSPSLSFAGPITIKADINLDSSANIGGITLNGTLNNSSSSGPLNVTFNAGTGDIFFGAQVGGINRIGDFTVINCKNIQGHGFTAASVSITESGGTVQSNGNLNTNTAAGITIHATNLVRGGNALASNGGPLVAVFSGTATATGPFSVTAGSIVLNGTGAAGAFGGGLITADTGGIEILSSVTLIADSFMDTHLSGGDLHYYSTINGNHNLTINLGTGNLFIDGSVGGSTPIAAFTANHATNLTIGTSNANVFKASSISQPAGTGTTLINSAVTTTGASGIAITNTNIIRGAAITTTGGGGLTLTLNPGGALTSTAAGAISLSGALTESGGAAVNLSGAISTSSGGISFATPITLMGSTSITTAGGGVTLPITDGFSDLTLAAGSGDIITSDVGSHTRIGTLTVNNCTNFTAPSITASAVTMTGSGGTLTLNGNLDTNSASGITLVANTSGMNPGNISLQGVNASSGGPLNLTYSGTSSGSSQTFRAGSITATATGSGVLQLAENLIADTGGIAIHSPVTLTGDYTADTSLSGGDIHFFNTVTGAHDGILTAGTGNISFDVDLTGVDLLKVVSAQNVTTGAISAHSVVQLAGTGTTLFGGAVATSDAAGITLTGNAFNFGNTVTTTTTGPLKVNNTGTLTLSTGASISGPIQQTGSGAVSLSGNIDAGGLVSWSGPVTLAAATSIDTSVSGSDVSFSNTLNGGQNLTLNLGASGGLTFGAPVGGSARLGALTITNAQNVTGSTITAASLEQTGGTGTTILGTINTNALGGISLTGTAFTLNGDLITTSLGAVTIANTSTLNLIGGSNTSITGDFTQSGGGGVSLAGTLTTVNKNLSFANNVSLTAATSLSTGSGVGTITLSGNVNGAQNLTLTAGTGDIVFSGLVGNTTPLSTLTLQSAANIAYPTTVVNTLVQNASTAATTINSPITSLGVLGVNISTATLTQSSSITASTGPITITHTGLYNMTSSLNAAGTITENGTSGTVQLNGSVTTTSNNISFANPITLTGASTLSTGIGSGNITFSSPINGLVAGAQNLNLTAGTGTINFAAQVGSTTRIGALIVNSGVVNTNQAIVSASVSQLSGSGTYGSLFTSSSDGIDLQGTTFTLPQNITTTGGGKLTLQNSGALILSGPTFTIAGAVNQIGLGTTTLSSNVTAAGVLGITNTGIVFTGPVIASANGSLNTPAGHDIQLLSTLNGVSSGVGNLTFNPGAAGNVSIIGNVGSTTRMGALNFTNANNITASNITAASILQSAGTGETTLIGNLNTNGINGMSFTGHKFTINGTLTTTNAGPVSIAHTGVLTLTAGSGTLLAGPFTESGTGGTVVLAGVIHAENANVSFANPITLAANTTINSNSGGDILVSSPVDGPFDLVYIAGTGNITLAAAIGGVTPVNSLTFTSATDISTQAISAGKIIQSSGIGTTTFNGGLQTTLSDGIDLTGNAFTFDAAVTTTVGGKVSINNTGLLTIPASAPFNLDGPFTQVGSGVVSLCTTITTTGDAITFAGPVTLCADASLDSGSDFGNIQFSNAVNGAHTLLLAAGQGNVILSSTIGGITPLSLLHITNGVNLTANTIIASAIDISGITGLATFNGPLTSQGASGISIDTVSATFNANITTLNSGPLLLTNSGNLNMGPSLTFSASGPFTQTGSGSLLLRGTITTSNQPISIAGPIDLTGDLALLSGGNAITLGSDLEGPFSVIITAGGGDVTAPSAFSITDPLQNFTVVSAHDISLNGVGAAEAPLSGILSLNASNTISFMNTTYAAHEQFYSAPELDFSNIGLITLITTGGNLTFASPTAVLSNQTDLSVQTNGGTFSFVSLHGTNFENLTIDTGTGLASMGALPNLGNLNTLIVNAGQIVFNDPMDVTNANFTSLGSISNASTPVAIDSTNTAFFNALGGNVGSISSPILINTSNQIFAGAGGSALSLADFNGTSVDNTVHDIPSNPPCIIIFNSIPIHECTAPPPPSPPSPGGGGGAGVIRFIFPFAVPGFDSSFFNLASYYFFYDDFLDKRYLRTTLVPMYYRPSNFTHTP